MRSILPGPQPRQYLQQLIEEESAMREMRRFKQALTPEQCEEILNQGTSGVLAAAGEPHPADFHRSA